MKRLVALLIAAMLLCSAAMAEDLSIQMVGGDLYTEATSLEDIVLGASYEIDGYAEVLPQTFMFVDSFAQYNKDMAGNNDQSETPDNGTWPVFSADPLANNWSYYYNQMYWNDSGTNADFAWLHIDLANLTKGDLDFTEEASVKVVYDDEYEFIGWVRQMNYDYNTIVFRGSYDEPHAPTAVLDPTNEEAIGMLYTGSFIFGCTLPNKVVEDKNAPLRLEIKLGESDIIYNIRK